MPRRMTAEDHLVFQFPYQVPADQWTAFPKGLSFVNEVRALWGPLPLNKLYESHST